MPTFEEIMKAAHKRAILNKDCDGSKDCRAPHHLICCLSLEEVSNADDLVQEATVGEVETG